MLAVAPGYLILVLLLIFATRNRGWIKRRLAKDEVMMRMGNGSKVDVIPVGTYLYINHRD